MADSLDFHYIQACLIQLYIFMLHLLVYIKVTSLCSESREKFTLSSCVLHRERERDASQVKLCPKFVQRYYWLSIVYQLIDYSRVKTNNWARQRLRVYSVTSFKWQVSSYNVLQQRKEK